MPNKVEFQSCTVTKTFFTLTGNNDVILAANPNRKGFRIFNRLGNSQVDVDDAANSNMTGANQGRTVLAGNDYYSLPELWTTGALIGRGTNADVINIWEFTNAAP